MAGTLTLLIAAIAIIVDILAAIWIVFFQRRDPTNTIPWLMLLLIFPVLGIFLYFAYGVDMFLLPIIALVLFLLFGLNYVKPRKFEIKAERDRENISRIMAEQKLQLEAAKADMKDAEIGPYLDMIEMLLRSNQAFVTPNNEVKLYVRGVDKFDALFEEIKKAKDFIHMEYYIIRNDELGNKMVAALTEKAKEGVEVRFLVDALGNDIPNEKYQDLISAGGKVAVFYKTLIKGLSLRVNYHDHRKIAVIDGKIGFLGGFNIGDEYLGKGPLGWWRDSAVRIHGNAVKALELRFFLDWNYATNEQLGGDPRYFPKVESHGESSVQIVSGGPDTKWDPIKYEYLKMITSARKHFYLQTPYFIPDQTIFDALRSAALSGIDVRIMFPNKPDHPFVYWASYSFVGELLRAGVKAYTYENGFIHAKTATVDDIASSVGTANWDIRSFRLNFETNAVIYDKDFAKQMREVFEEDIEKCKEVTIESYSKRSTWIKMKESVSRIFSPVL